MLMQLVAPSDVESKFRALEGSDVDDDLAKMKAALGSGKVAGQVRRRCLAWWWEHCFGMGCDALL